MVIPVDSGSTPVEIRRRTWASNLAQALAAKPMTPKAFHQALATAGCKVTLQAVYQWLAGETSPSPERQAAIASVLAIPASLLFPVIAA
jgi:hypothetical protein